MYSSKEFSVLDKRSQLIMSNESVPITLDDDSVPSDFFDDFSNQEFMAGLDVVDAWDDEKLESIKNESVAGKVEKSSRRKRSTRTRRSQSNDRQKKPKNYIEVKSEFKRDPEKVKRDIQKDKDKWTKNNEAKLLSERLKMVETGLVPPGMETEVDLNDIQPAVETDSSDKLQKKSLSFDLSTRLASQNRRSPQRRKSSGRSTSRNRSSGHRAYSNRNSTYRRSNSTSRRSGGQRSSPHRRYSRSPSDRDRWIRHRNYRRKPSPARLVSDRRSWNAPKDFLEELADKLKYNEKKKKILKEISHKLNDTPRIIQPVHNTMFMHGMGMLGPPNQFLPSSAIIDAAPRYDQAFFIGSPATFTNSNPNLISPHCIPNQSGFPLIVPQPNHRRINTNAAPKDHNQEEDNKKTASKLLEDKTISLSDYLSMSANYKADSSKPVNIHKKVKVLAQCQDALKALGNNSNFGGRFFYAKKSIQAEQQTFAKCLSPLRKIPVTRLNFTTPWKGGDDKGVLQPLHKLMVSLGLPFHQSNEERPASADSAASDIIYVPNQPVQTQSAPEPTVVRFQTKITQTNLPKCEECHKRKQIKYESKDVQFNGATCDASTQITDEDLMRLGLKIAVTDITKKSLAHLTPAQLLLKHESSKPLSNRQPPEKMHPNNSSRHGGATHNQQFQPPNNFYEKPSGIQNSDYDNLNRPNPFVQQQLNTYMDGNMQNQRRFAAMEDTNRMQNLPDGQMQKPFYEPPRQQQNYGFRNYY